MPEYTKVSFNYRKDISDYSDLVEMLFPGNRNQQHAATCILFELKWADNIPTEFAAVVNWKEKPITISPLFGLLAD